MLRDRGQRALHWSPHCRRPPLNLCVLELLFQGWYLDFRIFKLSFLYELAKHQTALNWPIFHHFLHHFFHVFFNASHAKQHWNLAFAGMLLALILKALLDDFCFSLQRGGNSVKQRRRKKTSIFSTFAYRARGVVKNREQWLHKDTHEHQTALVSAIF